MPQRNTKAGGKQDSIAPIAEIEKGGPSMLYAWVANKVIRAVNGILRLSVSPSGWGRFEFATAGSKLILDKDAIAKDLGVATQSRTGQLQCSFESATTVRVTHGTIGGFVPAPMPFADDWIIDLTLYDIGYIYGWVRVSSGNTKEESFIGVFEDIPANTSERAYIQIATFNKTEQGIGQSVAGSVEYSVCREEDDTLSGGTNWGPI